MLLAYKDIIKNAFNFTASLKDEGKIATYISELAKVNPAMFGVHMTKIDGANFGIGDYSTKFSIQSIAKVLALTLAYKIVKDDLWKRVNVEPSGTRFDSLLLLESYKGIPRNPFMNSGALVVCDILLSN